ncbi:MAG: NF038122 family metalloprotease, partial [Polymorphobacter sp.]
VGVAAHEIGHALGFRSGVDLADQNALPNRPPARGLGGIAWGTVHDLYRYGSFAGSQTLDWSIGGTPCFSINGGMTCLTTLSTGRFNGDGRQASHWKDDTLLNISPPIGIMDPTATGPGGVRPFMTLSKYDLIAFDTMGYDMAVPEPASWAMMIAGFGLVGGALRLRRDSVAAAAA